MSKLEQNKNMAKCPFTYENCQYAKVCLESFEHRGDAELNDCPIAVRWQEFRECLFLPHFRKRKAIMLEKTKVQNFERDIAKLAKFIRAIPPSKLTPEISMIALRMDALFSSIVVSATTTKGDEKE